MCRLSCRVNCCCCLICCWVVCFISVVCMWLSGVVLRSCNCVKWMVGVWFVIVLRR